MLYSGLELKGDSRPIAATRKRTRPMTSASGVIRRRITGRRLIGIVSGAISLSCHAQIPTTLRWQIQEVQNECISLESERDAIPTRDCTVQEFDHLFTTDTHDFYYALYRDLLETPSELNLRVWDGPAGNKNVLILFAANRGAEYVSLYRALHDDRSKLGPYGFQAPEIIETMRGAVLHIIRRGIGSGMWQWFNDEYWLWQWNDWQKLDVTSWYKQAENHVPGGSQLGGVSYTSFDLSGLSNTSPVRRNGDAMCCPSGGILTVHFDWVDLSLSIREIEYDPDTDTMTRFER